MADCDDIYDDVVAVDKAVGGVASKLAMFEKSGFLKSPPLAPSVTKKPTNKKNPPLTIDTSNPPSPPAKKSGSLMSPKGALVLPQIPGGIPRDQRTLSIDADRGTLYPPKVNGTHPNDVSESKGKIAPATKPKPPEKPKPTHKPNLAKKTPKTNDSSGDNLPATTKASPMSTPPALPKGRPKEAEGDVTKKAEVMSDASLRSRPLPLPGQPSNNLTNHEKEVITVTKQPTPVTTTTTTNQNSQYPKQAEAGLKTYSMLPTPANSDPAPTKPSALGYVDLTEFGAEDDDFYDDIGDDSPLKRPLPPPVVHKTPTTRPVSTVSQIPELGSDEEEEEDVKLAMKSGNVVMRPKNSEPAPAQPESEIYDDVAGGYGEDDQEVYEEI